MKLVLNIVVDMQKLNHSSGTVGAFSHPYERARGRLAFLSRVLCYDDSLEFLSLSSEKSQTVILQQVRNSTYHKG